MNKRKFEIPMPDEKTIQAQVESIVVRGVARRPSFYAYIKSMYAQLGFRTLLSDRSEASLLLIAAIYLLLFGAMLITPDAGRIDLSDLYAYIFLVSPLLFGGLTIYAYAHKQWSGTYEVEMACKYNVYQMTAFRMLLFSVAAIVINTALLGVVAAKHDLSFLRAVMISNTSLFVFSVFFLFVMMKRRTTLVAAATIVGWLAVNLLLLYSGFPFYDQLLTNLPLAVYALVAVGSGYLYLRGLRRVLQLKFVQGA